MKAKRNLTYSQRLQRRCRLLYLVLAAMLAYTVLIGELGGGDSRKMTDLMHHVSHLLFFGGRQQKAEPAQMQARGIPFADAKMLVRSLRQLCQAADICVSDLMLLEKDSGSIRLSGTADDAMLDLLTALMEAKASGRGDLALRSLSQAEQYLHMLGVELVFCGTENTALFDILPTMGETRTIRPAMMQDGKLLRRGVAALNTEKAGRSMGA